MLLSPLTWLTKMIDWRHMYSWLTRSATSNAVNLHVRLHCWKDFIWCMKGVAEQNKENQKKKEEWPCPVFTWRSEEKRSEISTKSFVVRKVNLNQIGANFILICYRPSGLIFFNVLDCIFIVINGSCYLKPFYVSYLSCKAVLWRLAQDIVTV